MKSINIILPYKESYSSINAGAVSILVSQLSRLSRFKNKIKVFGSLPIKKPITNNYRQTFVHKPFFYFSRTNYYLRLLNGKIKNNINEFIEIHNRPQAAKFFIKRKTLCVKVLFFHNSPKELRGSKTKRERIFLLNNLDKIIFVSEWCKRIFFEDLNIFDSNKAHVIYPGSDFLKKIPKKNNLIVYAGKIGRAHV